MLDGNSEMGAHVPSAKEFVLIDKSRIFFFLQQNTCFHHACASRADSPANISAMGSDYSLNNRRGTV